MTRPIRIAINGFGRIGRTVLRQLATDPAHADIEIAAINDIAPLDSCAYLFRYDSAFGPFPGTVTTGREVLNVAGRAIPFWHRADLRGADLRGADLRDVDVVLECTGRAKTHDIASAGLDAGARRVLISGPSKAAEATIVMGANDHEIGGARIVSNSSCTTNAIVPLLRSIDLGLGVERAHITTVHCYTGSQPTVDKPGPNLERSRAAAVSIVPTTTSAASETIEILPEFQGRLSVAAVRVPVLSVSAIDAVFQISESPDERLDEFIREAFQDCHLIGLSDEPNVSTDMRARPESLVIALRETRIVGHKQLRVFGWYDNEWGFSARMIEMARRLAGRP
ncbi:glyceraldehyde 3-phosphate dehydrogenase NAD-binding domain-containing protein [Marivita sp. GX14005]|uniref:type I glyceraldehyde-3-phosphate dehydrogenase n=1 Tax=Marivita sp. GX14005 TaxID=2942276 RepID=UPI0020193EA2|nr:glyceraldehyde 3-phosphate dehydrogenase NAD-binding domain-containing protein [Marivita sp. GX14005]MCL3883260.1 aldehyde dehydrogenase [Marivita sp. GX14005]